MRVSAPASSAPWYRRWWRISLQTVRGVTRLQDTPHRIAVGVGSGLFVSVLPIFGQTFLGILLTRLLGGNVVASLPWSWLSNPVTSPFIFYGCYRVGAVLVPGHTAISWEELHGMLDRFDGMGLWQAITSAAEVFAGVLIPLWLGGLAVGGVLGLAGFLAVRAVVAALQARRGLPSP